MNSNLSKTIEDVLAVDCEKANNEISDERDVREAIAPYQKEFPYDRDEEGQVTRREFCNFLFLTSSALLLSAVVFAGHFADDDWLYSDHHRPVAAAPSTGYTVGAAQPSHRWFVAVFDIFCHGADV